MSAITGPGAGSQAMAAFGPPYPPTHAALGGVPSEIPDIPITAVFLLLFILGAAAHVTIFKLNKSQGHLFFLSMFMFGFCMCRIVTCSLRIAWSTHQRNVSLGIAAQIFVQVGTVLLFIINLVFAQRVIRAQHPNWGWHQSFRVAFRATLALTVLTLAMMIVVGIQGFFTLSTNTHRIDRDVQFYGSSYFVFVAFLPIPVILLGVILPKRVRVEKFGIGRFRHKIMILLTAAAVLTLGAGWRAGTLFLKPVPLTESPWYFSKACFYIFDFTTEVIVVALYAIVRVDRRFFVPNKSKGPGDYSRKKLPEKDAHTLLPAHPGDFEKNEYKGVAGYDDFSGFNFDTPYASTLRVYSEEELFDDTATLAETLKYSSTSLELDNVSGRWLLKRQSQQSLYSDPFRDDASRRSTIKTSDSNLYSTLEVPPATGRSITAFNPEDVKWETISMAHTHAPSYRSRDDANGSYSSLLINDEKPHHYSRDAGLEKPQRAKGDTWASLSSEKARQQSYHSLTSDATAAPPRTPHSEKRPAMEKTGLNPYSHEGGDEGDLGDKKNYKYDRPETGDLKERRQKRESLEVPSWTKGHNRKSSWRKSVELEMRLSFEEERENELENAYEKLVSGKDEEQKNSEKVEQAVEQQGESSEPYYKPDEKAELKRQLEREEKRDEKQKEDREDFEKRIDRWDQKWHQKKKKDKS